MERPDSRPTERQIYAIATALCERAGEEWPEHRAAASELIERLRTENGHPEPRLEDVPLRPRRRPRQGSGYGHGAEKLAVAIARRLAEEMR